MNVYDMYAWMIWYMYKNAYEHMHIYECIWTHTYHTKMRDVYHDIWYIRYIPWHVIHTTAAWAIHIVYEIVCIHNNHVYIHNTYVRIYNTCYCTFIKPIEDVNGIHVAKT